MKNIRWRSAIVGGLSAVVIGCIASTTGHAISSGGIGGRPANPNPDDPRTQSIFIYTLDHSATVNDQVLVSNNTDDKQTINVYAVDGEVTNTGAYTCKQQSEARTELGAAIQVKQSQVTLEPHSNQAVDFSVTMPQNADVGEHNGCIVFANANQKSDTTGGVHLETRQAIRVVATVPGDLHRDITIQNFTTDIVGGSAQMSMRLQNKGNVSADVDAQVKLVSLFGGTVFSDGGSYPALPGQKLDLNFTDSKGQFWGGWYRASATISYDKRAGKFGVPTDGHDLVQKSSQEEIVFIMPSPIVIVVAGGIVALFVLWLVWRARQKRAVRSWSDYTFKSTDTIESVAAKHAIGWKKLAKVNGIKPPYLVQPGDILRVPDNPATASKRKQPSANEDAR